jgi:hypothetical protein
VSNEFMSRTRASSLVQAGVQVQGKDVTTPEWPDVSRSSQTQPQSWAHTWLSLLLGDEALGPTFLHSQGSSLHYLEITERLQMATR